MVQCRLDPSNNFMIFNMYGLTHTSRYTNLNPTVHAPRVNFAEFVCIRALVDVSLSSILPPFQRAIEYLKML